MNKLLYIGVLILASSLYGQQKQPIYIIEGDTLTNPYVDLSEVVVLPSVKFKTYDDYIAYYRLQRRTIKVYPYAKLAADNGVFFKLGPFPTINKSWFLNGVRIS